MDDFAELVIKVSNYVIVYHTLSRECCTFLKISALLHRKIYTTPYGDLSLNPVFGVLPTTSLHKVKSLCFLAREYGISHEAVRRAIMAGRAVAE